MPLEATIVVLDNSAWSLNGDYGTTRWDSQLDALKTLYNTKMNSNPENVLGVMTMAGKSPEVLASPTQNFGAIISAISDVRLQGEVDLMTGINVAQLALKHRQNKNQRQRVIVFVGSPLDNLQAPDLVKLGKKLKKNNVAVDIVNFGEDAENEEKLREFIEAVNSAENSHLVSVPAGTILLSDMILSSSMLADDGVVPSGGGGDGVGGGAAGAGGSGGDGGDFGGIDPSLDPELAMALRMSLEEEQARQQRNQQQQSGSTQSASEPATAGKGVLAGESLIDSANAPSAETAATSLPPELAASAASGPPQLPSNTNQLSSPVDQAAVGPTSSMEVKPEEQDADLGMSEDADEDADLAMALALSRGEGDDVDMDAAGTEGATESGGGNDGNDDEDAMTEDEAIARAIAMSMKDSEDQDVAK